MPITIQKRNNKKLTYKYVKELIEKENYKLLSNIYKNAQTKLEIQCNKGHIYKVKWNHFQQGIRCPKCKGGIKQNYEYIKEQIESVKGYIFLSKIYKNCSTKLDIQCNKGHIYKVDWDHFKRGQRCPICKVEKMYLNYEYIKKQIKKHNHKLLSKNYKNCQTKLKIQCDKGHKYKLSWNTFNNGSRCPICFIKSKSSRAEFKIQKYLKKLNIPFIANDRTQIINPKTGYNLELDIWMPSLNKAIEYNGIYWHSSDNAKFKDIEKVKQCKKKGIDLLVIQEQKGINNFDKVLNNFL